MKLLNSLEAGPSGGGLHRRVLGGRLARRHDLARADRLGGGLLRRGVLAADEGGEERRHVLRVAVLERDHLHAGVGIRLDVELPDQGVKERVLPGVGDHDDLVRPVVGRVGGRGAELVRRGPGEHRLDLRHDVARLGPVLERVELGLEAVLPRLVDRLQEPLDLLDVLQGVGDHDHVGLLKGHQAAPDSRGHEGLDLGHEFRGAKEGELEDLRGDLAARGQVEEEPMIISGASLFAWESAVTLRNRSPIGDTETPLARGWSRARSRARPWVSGG